MQRGDIFMVDLEPTQGREQRGHRPVLGGSPNDFNRATGLPVILPITNGGEFARRIRFAVPLAGTPKQQALSVVTQPRVLDVHARHGRKIEGLPPALLHEVLQKVITIFQ